MGRNAVDPVRRLTLALLLASVAALGASVGEGPLDEDRPEEHRIVTAPSPPPGETPWRLGSATVYDERRCTERALERPHVTLVELVRRP
jgi:hypothetical protein